MSSVEKAKKIIKQKESSYDSGAGLLKVHVTPNYHSNLPEGDYHEIRASSEFAAGIFYAGIEELYDTANEVLKKVVSLQRKTGDLRGLWSYYYEESLEQMHAPDWNFADFNAIPILNILKDHKDKLKDGMYEILCDASVNACHAIMKRNLTVIYTNPTVMDIFVTVVCGEICKRPEFISYGKEKLDRFYRHIMSEKTFDEYNCPGYSMLIAEIFSIMLRHIKSQDIIEKVSELNYIVWEMLGRHFHFKTGEIAGPNIRRYVNFLTQEERTKFKNAAGVNIISDEDEQPGMLSLMYAPKCPEELLYLFNRSHSEDYSHLFTKGSNYPWFNQPNIDTLFMTEDYSLGSFSLMDGWNQRSSLTAYIGDRQEKCCVRLRILHDFYDFSSGAVNTVQHKGAAVTVVNFHTNHGDTHVDLDPIQDGTIKASDLRVRFQIEANNSSAVKKIKYKKEKAGYSFDILGTPVSISFPFAEISGGNPYMEISYSANEIFADMILYSGEPKQINLKKLKSLCAVATISVGENQLIVKDIKTYDDYISVFAAINGKNAEIKALKKPDAQITSTMSTSLSVDGERFEKISDI